MPGVDNCYRSSDSITTAPTDAAAAQAELGRTLAAGLQLSPTHWQYVTLTLAVPERLRQPDVVPVVAAVAQPRMMRVSPFTNTPKQHVQFTRVTHCGLCTLRDRGLTRVSRPSQARPSHCEASKGTNRLNCIVKSTSSTSFTSSNRERFIAICIGR